LLTDGSEGKADSSQAASDEWTLPCGCAVTWELFLLSLRSGRTSDLQKPQRKRAVAAAKPKAKKEDPDVDMMEKAKTEEDDSDTSLEKPQGKKAVAVAKPKEPDSDTDEPRDVSNGVQVVVEKRRVIPGRAGRTKHKAFKVIANSESEDEDSSFYRYS